MKKSFMEWTRGTNLWSNYLKTRNITIFAILNYFLLLLMLYVILITPTAKGYEYSIYSAYPKYFWYLLISSIFLGMMIAILSLLNSEIKIFWLVGFLAEVIAVSLLLFLPMIRGYFIYGSGDVLTHIGYMLDIEKTGSFGPNHYPGFHVLGIIIKYLSGLSYGAITMMLTAILSLVSIIFWFMLGKATIKDHKAIVILMLIATLPMLTSGLFTPNSLANLFIPLMLFFSVKNIAELNFGLSFCFVLLSLSMVFFHPLAAIMTMLMMTILVLYNGIYNYYLSNNVSDSKLIRVLAIMIIVFFSWSSYLIMFLHVVKPLVGSLTGSTEAVSGFAEQLDLISRVDVSFLYLAKLTMYTYGVIIIFGILTSICVIIILYNKFNNGKLLSSNYFLYYSMFCCILFYIMTLSIYFSISNFNISRIYRLALIFSFIVVACTITIAINNNFNFLNGFKKILVYLFFLFLFLSLIYFSVFGFHLSPLIKKSHQQVMESNSFATQHLFENMDVSMQVIDHGAALERFKDFHYGKSTTLLNNIALIPLEDVPDHFGYNEGHGLEYYHDQDVYYILTDQYKGYYPNMYPEFPDNWRYTDLDFQLLELDSSVDIIYSNKFSYIFYINSNTSRL